MKLMILILGISMTISPTVSAIAWNGNWAFSCDWNGGDIGNTRVRGEDCSNACEKRPGCTHYTWTNYNGGTCWMKKGSVTKSNAIQTNNGAMVCGLLASTPSTGNTGGAIAWNGNWAFSCDWNGGDILNARIRGEDCSSACENKQGCTHFTWTTYNGGTCWMKGGTVTKSNAIKTNDKSMVCGLINPTVVVNPGGSGSMTDLDIARQLGLNQHNLYRQKHRVGSLTLDSSINNIAQNYANYLAANNLFEHSGAQGYGENLYMFWSSNIGSVSKAIQNAVVDATNSWYSEVSLYNFASGQFGSDTGHFTQLVWRGSTRVGFGVAHNNGKIYVVANYASPGNVIGQFQSNVFPA